MTAPVQHKKLVDEFVASYERYKKSQKAQAPFSEALHKRVQYSQHRHQTKTITMGQAQKLARYAPIIQEAAHKNNVPVELICGVILHESGGNPRALSPAGARGLMQLMPETAKRFGVTNSFDLKQNIEGGTKYLRYLLDHFHGNVELTLAGYNAGEKNVEKYGNNIPPFRETQNYVPSVLGYTLAMAEILRQGRATQPATPIPPNAKMA